jgi:hypothetical protein
VSNEELIKQMDALKPWHQIVRITPDLSTEIYDEQYTGRKMVSHKFTGQFVNNVYKENMINKTMLDCGCNAGAHLFGAANIGIKSGFGFDVRELWINQANWLKNNITIHRTDHLKFKVMNIYDIPKNNIGKFDITMYSGLFYHVEDPFLSLKILSDVTDELLIINTMFEETHDQDNGKDCMYFKNESIFHPLNGVHGVSWVPSGENVIVKMLEPLGFVEFYLMFKRVLDKNSNGRLAIAASKVPNLLKNASPEAYTSLDKNQLTKKIKY